MTTAIERSLALARRSHERSIEELRALVRIPSLTGEEGEAQQYIAGKLDALGAKTTIAEPDVAAMFARFPDVAQYPTHWQHDLILPYGDLPTYEALRASGLESVLNYRGRPNVVGVFAGSGGGRSLILNGHIDTVTLEPIGDWTKQPFGAEIEDGLMYGRGTSDMKGGLMAALMALTYLREAGITLPGDIMLQSVVNEEHAGNGTLDLVCRGYTADAAIVLEPTNNSIAVSHPGGLYWQVTVPGTARSPGARWQNGVKHGISAIEKLPGIIDALLAVESHYNAAMTTRSMAGSGVAPFSLVIGKVLGGHYETVTAAEATLRGGAYFQPGVGEIRDVMKSFTEAIGQASRHDAFLAGNPARLEFLHHDDSTLQPPDIAIAAAMAGTLTRHGARGDICPGPFACDMRHLVNQGGIPSVIFGPGTIAQAHKPDEHIAIAEYLECIEYLIDFIPAWCSLPRETKERTAGT
ncbi:MAG: M20/M25/M40 family metallo-hydrolase [Betaproteobacteria bacterium]